jgi:hypothetical protein
MQFAGAVIQTTHPHGPPTIRTGQSHRPRLIAASDMKSLMKATLARTFCLLISSVLLTLPACGGDISETTPASAPPLRMVLAAPEGTPIDVLDSAAQVLELRLRDAGFTTAGVQVAAPRLVVVLPAASDRERVRMLLTTPGQLSIRPVLEANQWGVSPLLTAATDYEQAHTPTTAEGQTGGTARRTSPDLTPVLPPGITVCDSSVDLVRQPGCVDGTTGTTLSDDPTRETWLAFPHRGEVLHLAAAQILGDRDLADAQAVFAGPEGLVTSTSPGATTSEIGEWLVLIDFNPEGAARFQEMVAQLAAFPFSSVYDVYADPGNQRRRMALVLDGVVRWAPMLLEDVTPTTDYPDPQALVLIDAVDDQEQAARDLAVVLRIGPLPVPLSVVDDPGSR